MEIQLAKMVSLLLVVWIIAWTPYAILSVWIIIFDAKGLTPMLALVPTVCCKSSAALNSFLYGIG
jgi:hypothetical protein